MNDSGSISGSSTVRNLSCSAQGDSGSIPFTSGFYLLRIAITAGTGTDKRIITRTEIVHIYPDTTTEVVAAFTALDFTSLILGGTIQILENESVNYVYAYSDAQHTNLIGSAPVDTGTWYMPVQSYQEASRIYFKATLTSASTLFLDAGSIPTPLDSKTDIVLGENLYKLAGPTWSEDTMTEGTIQYYYFYAKPGEQYTIKWDDYQDGSGTSGDITVSAYQGNRQYFFTDVDSGYTSPQTVQIIRGGYVILKIENGSRDGTYRICAMSDAKSISWVTFQGISNARIHINESNKSIIGEMPYGTDIAHLEPRFTHTGADYSPHGVQDFTNPVDYTVIAEDGTVAVYTVTLSVRGQANIKLPSFVDEIIQGFPETPISLSKDVSGTIHTTSIITIADTGYDEYQWYVDNRVKPGDRDSSGRSLTLDALNYAPGTHTVSLVVYKNGVPYSQEQTFTVTILKGQIGISIAGPSQPIKEIVQGFLGLPISLSKNASGTVHTTSIITIDDTGYEEYQWYVDNRVKSGDSGSSGCSLTLDALNYAPGTHTVSIVVYKNGIP
jgi:hypothetical protein